MIETEQHDLARRLAVEGPAREIIGEDLGMVVAVAGGRHQLLGGTSVAQVDLVYRHAALIHCHALETTLGERRQQSCLGAGAVDEAVLHPRRGQHSVAGTQGDNLVAQHGFKLTFHDRPWLLQCRDGYGS